MSHVSVIMTNLRPCALWRHVSHYILNLITKWRWVMGFTLSPWKVSPVLIKWDARCNSEPMRMLWRTKNLNLLGIKPEFLGCRPITIIQTTLLWLPSHKNQCLTSTKALSHDCMQRAWKWSYRHFNRPQEIEVCVQHHTVTVLSLDEDFLMLIEYQAALSPSSGEKKNSSCCCLCEFQLLKFHSQVFCWVS